VFRKCRCQLRGETAKRLAALMGLRKLEALRSLQGYVSSASCSHGAAIQLATRLHQYWLLATRSLRRVASWSLPISIPKERDALKRITLSTLLLVGLSLVGSQVAVAQGRSSSQPTAADSTANAITDQQLALLRSDIRSIKKQLIAANLQLTDSEPTKFWQVYEQYSAETEKINDTRVAIIKEYSDEYGTLTDDQADNLIRRWLDADIDQTKLRQRYVAIFRQILPGKKAATFFQLDRRISTMIDVQLTSQLPLAQSQD
jgi:hypothetical protein